MARLTPSALAIWGIVRFCSRISRAASSLAGVSERWAAAEPSARAGRREAGAGALADDLALELSQRAEDVELEHPGAGGCVDLLGQ